MFRSINYYSKFLITLLSFLLIQAKGFSNPDSNYNVLSDTVKKTSPQQPVYTTSRLVTEKPVIDGKLNDECWTKGTWAGNFRQWIPNEGAKPTYPTEFNIQYDDKNLYVAIRCHDGEPEKILQAGRCQG